MKLRKHKKLLYANVKNNRPFSYYVNNVMMTLAKASQKMSQALHDVYRGRSEALTNLNKAAEDNAEKL